MSMGIPKTDETNGLLELRRMIAGVIAQGWQGKTRNEALKAVQWCMKADNGQYAGLSDTLACALVPMDRAMIFDGRDNEVLKLSFYQQSLGVKLSIEILPQITKYTKE